MDKERASVGLEGKAELAKAILRQDHSKKRRICKSLCLKKEAWGRDAEI